MYLFTIVDIVSLPTFTFNKEIIIESIYVLQTIGIYLGLVDKIISYKVVMM